jgi:hypothetical protein
MAAELPPLPPPPLSRDEWTLLQKRRRGRNIAMLIALLAIAALFYAIAMVKLSRPDLASH